MYTSHAGPRRLTVTIATAASAALAAKLPTPIMCERVAGADGLPLIMHKMELALVSVADCIVISRPWGNDNVMQAAEK